ncbi:hypothetical protein LYSHEL_22440 [Lysobacter helvus]|uniref:DUF1704 domain-containing protein n=2 Tax=Lysobacteraceae TaxID=32033 RepID=A0ABM7Q726_9GAMM|nr:MULTISPECIES: tyrosine/phenylalanine carboxypeptidase domain-containing protein [Lysobacter]BCT93221.1 hypothetical protein LYSCAS_22450 [Lysobacter caseinilyticus]BCT96373.1 hypothetical protein LYSHEL_22440 [Lysobacter helvus]
MAAVGVNTVANAGEDLSRLQAWDSALVKLGKKITVLKCIEWPIEVETRFLDGWKRGAPELPSPPPCTKTFKAEAEGLQTLMGQIDRGHPIGHWLYKTAWSYLVAARMLEGAGTEEFTRCSTYLYGRPDRRFRSQEITAADGAREMIRVTDEMTGPRITETRFDIPAEEFARRLRDRIGPIFCDDDVAIVLDPNLPSKATACSTRITLRATALFSERDLDQLAEHEAFIHTLTALNGKHQPNFRALALGAPRTTKTQEGLATFSEIITGAIDIARLRRIALRVVMLEKALAGADFIEIFKGFLDAGQSEIESYRSAARLFRGGDVRGRICFTKDGAYLEGVMIVHAFIRKVLQEGRGELLPLLFAGRVTTADVLTLAPYLESGVIAHAHYVPPWARDPQRVLATMAYSAGTQRLRMDTFDLQRFVAYEDEVIAESGIGA